MKTTILIVDDHPLMRKGLCHALQQRPEFVLAGEASTGATAISTAIAIKPHLIVMDLHLPDISGVEATRQVLEALPNTKVVIFSADTARNLVDMALEAGACGYILKKSVEDELALAIHAVMTGKLYLSAEISAGILEDYRKELVGDNEPTRPVLTEREKELLRCISAGQRNKDIAAMLKLSPNTVQTYRSRLMRKTGCASTADLVRYAVRQGVASL